MSLWHKGSAWGTMPNAVAGESPYWKSCERPDLQECNSWRKCRRRRSGAAGARNRQAAPSGPAKLTDSMVALASGTWDEGSARLARPGGRRRRRGLGGRPQRHRRVTRRATQPLVLRVHRDPEGQDHRALRQAGAERQAGAVPRLQHAPGDRGGLHPRRAAALHRLRHLLPDREGGRGRPRVPEAPRLRRAREVPEPAPRQRRPAHRGHHRALPRPRAPPH